MIDLDEIERRITDFGSGVHGDIAIELITRLRQAEKDAARYRWLRDDYRHEYCVDDLFDGSSNSVDKRIDEAMQCK